MKKFSILLLFIVFFGVSHAYAQETSNKTSLPNYNSIAYLPNGKGQTINFVIATNYASEHFGFICKKELSLEKRTKVPIRLRMGSLDNCNWLEGKLRYKPLGN